MHTLQLNYLTEELKKVLPPTDTRFRPDLRAYENGDSKFASKEKKRLKEKQKKTRKFLKEKKLVRKPIYFASSTNSETNETNYIFTGKYWEDRQKGNWNKLADIYGTTD